MHPINTSFLIIISVIGIGLASAAHSYSSPTVAKTTPTIQLQPCANLDSPAVVDDEFKPVDNMHHFMEYIYEPVYDQLKDALAKEPTDKAGWGRIKSGAMILAESSTLLASRKPDEGSQELWKSASLTVHQNGTRLFEAGRKKDYQAVKKSFAAMSEGCKKCHEAFRK